MLSSDSEIEALDPVRIATFEEAKAEVIGEAENAVFTSTGLGLGIIGSYLVAKLSRRKPQNICVHSVDPVWVALGRRQQQNRRARHLSCLPMMRLPHGFFAR